MDSLLEITNLIKSDINSLYSLRKMVNKLNDTEYLTIINITVENSKYKFELINKYNKASTFRLSMDISLLIDEINSLGITITNIEFILTCKILELESMYTYIVFRTS